MKKNGFTLVELIAIIVLLAIMTLIALPSLLSTTEKSKNEEYELFKENIYMAAENYLMANVNNSLDSVTESGKTFIKIRSLMENEYINYDLTNPKDDSDISNNTVMITKNSDGFYDYEYLEGDYTASGYVQNGLVASYDGYSKPLSNNWKDYSLNNYEAAMHNFSADNWTGEAILFDGIDDYISIPINPNINLGQHFTVSVVLNASDMSNYRGIFGLHDSSSGARGIATQFNSNRFESTYGDGSTWNSIFTSSTDYLNKYVQYTVIYDGAQYVTVYINGKLVNRIATTKNIVHYNEVDVGRSYLSSNRYFKGKIADVQFYNYSLTADEIAQNYKVAQKRYNIGG